MDHFGVQSNSLASSPGGAFSFFNAPNDLLEVVRQRRDPYPQGRSLSPIRL